MAPKKYSISVRIPKGLKLTAKEAADLKKGFKMHAVRVVKTRTGPSGDINVINSGDINVINIASQIRRRKKSATKTKAKTKKR